MQAHKKSSFPWLKCSLAKAKVVIFYESQNYSSDYFPQIECYRIFIGEKSKAQHNERSYSNSPSYTPYACSISFSSCTSITCMLFSSACLIFPLGGWAYFSMLDGLATRTCAPLRILSIRPAPSCISLRLSRFSTSQAKPVTTT